MYIAALWIRYDFEKSRVSTTLEGPAFASVVVGSVVLSGLVGFAFGVYRGRFLPGSFAEACCVAAVLLGTSVAAFLVIVATQPAGTLPRGLPLVSGAFTVIAALSLRSFVRGREFFGAGVRSDADRVIVFGAGSGGQQLVRELRRSPLSTYNPVALLDDDPAKKNLVIESVRVRGTRDDLEVVASREKVGILIIAVPSLPPEEIVAVRDRAEGAGLHVLILPPLSALMTGRRAADELRQINVNDLLGRKPARLNQTQIAEYIRGKRILVTGAGGSIGSELCRQLLRFRPAELMMLDRDESGLHSTQLSIQKQSMLDGDDTILASIRDLSTLREIFADRRPEIVFHAAALKHMPLLEHYPLEALKTNVLGTLNLLDVSESSGVETFVNVSTDKAANPTNVLGRSKRVAERLTAGRGRRDGSSKYVSVRFGNVLGSRGSVLTVFEKQIAEGGPVTVTDPDVTRFFMTIPEACQLILQAAVIGRSGETLVLDMGEPVSIQEVARTLIEQSGKNVDIIYTGLRENEKVHEELFDSTEQPVVGDRHEAVSEVSVPPLACDRKDAEKVTRNDDASAWLARHAY
ncbi:nucleoside-diphosphate sugar epimerase/dehydratase [Dietzia sp. KRD202]|uniref:polysaccharide biosynthesis protein n=1 Tax=Dietzia sp. KRD202 TaxID=2729732 RepID=UPI0019D01DAA|nr:nucleoside-diphosphate sugar epimerase/dehydratase [Dietzia sp. KRD202]